MKLQWITRLEFHRSYDVDDDWYNSLLDKDNAQEILEAMIAEAKWCEMDDAYDEDYIGGSDDPDHVILIDDEGFELEPHDILRRKK